MFTWLFKMFQTERQIDLYCYILFGAKGPVDDPEKTSPVAIFNSYELALQEQSRINNSGTGLYIQYVIPCKLNTVHVIQNLLYGDV